MAPAKACEVVMFAGTSDMPQSRRRLVLSTIAIAVALLVGFLIGRSLAPDGGAGAPESSPSAGTPEADEFARTEAGAVEAATDFARVASAASEDKEAYRESLRSFASPAWISDAEKLADNTLEFLEQRYGLAGSFSFVPAKYRVADFSRNEATIELWGVTLSTGPKVDGIEETWVTGTVDLVWTADGWRVSGQDSATGPTPELLQTEDERGRNALDGFEEYVRVPTP